MEVRDYITIATFCMFGIYVIFNEFRISNMYEIIRRLIKEVMRRN